MPDQGALAAYVPPVSEFTTPADLRRGALARDTGIDSGAPYWGETNWRGPGGYIPFPQMGSRAAWLLWQGMGALGGLGARGSFAHGSGIAGARATAAERNQSTSRSGWDADNVVVPNQSSAMELAEGGAWRIPYGSNVTSEQLAGFGRMPPPPHEQIVVGMGPPHTVPARDHHMGAIPRPPRIEAAAAEFPPGTPEHILHEYLQLRAAARAGNQEAARMAEQWIELQRIRHAAEQRVEQRQAMPRDPAQAHRDGSLLFLNEPRAAPFRGAAGPDPAYNSGVRQFWNMRRPDRLNSGIGVGAGGLAAHYALNQPDLGLWWQAP